MTRFDCIVPSSDNKQLLLEKTGGRWTLPHVQAEEGWVANAVNEIQHDFRRRYGIATVVLRAIRSTASGVACELEQLTVAGRKEPGAPGLNGESRLRWRDVADCNVALLGEDQGATLASWLEGEDNRQDLAPWQEKGWYEQAALWIVERVHRAGLEIRGEIEQLKAAWNGSSVLKLDSSDGALYFKASPRRRPGEPAVIRLLSARWSRHLPQLVDADEERCWSLMRKAAGTDLNEDDTEALAEAGRLLARIQIDQIAEVGRWLDMGCPDRGLDTLQSRLERLLVGIPSALVDAGILQRPERDRIASFVPEANSLCRRLAEFSVPGRSLHHEDFRAGNILRGSNGNLIFIDWNEAVVAHPFFTIQRFLWFVDPPAAVQGPEILETPDDSSRRTLRDAYLEPFSQFEPKDRLLEAFAISSRLATVYDLLRFDASVDVDAALRRGLEPEEAANARSTYARIPTRPLEAGSW